MTSVFARFAQEEAGQDFVEYTLLIAFVVICTAALFLGQGDHITTIWRVTNNNLSAAAVCAGI